MLLYHDTYFAWIACAAAAGVLNVDQHVAQLARRRAWNKWRRCRPSPTLWGELIADEIRLILADSDEPPASGRL
jgi:hypothetical protein